MKMDKYEIISSNYNNFDLVFKIILIGDCDSRKSRLIYSLKKNNFEDSYNPTIGFGYDPFNIKYKDKVIQL